MYDKVAYFNPQHAKLDIFMITCNSFMSKSTLIMIKWSLPIFSFERSFWYGYICLLTPVSDKHERCNKIMSTCEVNMLHVIHIDHA